MSVLSVLLENVNLNVDETKTWIAPDIEVRQDALSLSKDKDPQLIRAVQELLKQLEVKTTIVPPKFSKPATGN